VGKERLVCLARIIDETVNPIKEPGEPLGIETSRLVALREAVPKRVIGSPLGRAPPVTAEDAEITAVQEPEDQRADGNHYRCKCS